MMGKSGGIVRVHITLFRRLTILPSRSRHAYSIPELVEAINLQSTGPTEASRALRKKLKYSNIHGQKRALTVSALEPITIG